MPRFLDEGQEPLQRCYKKTVFLKLLPFQGVWALASAFFRTCRQKRERGTFATPALLALRCHSRRSIMTILGDELSRLGEGIIIVLHDEATLLPVA